MPLKTLAAIVSFFLLTFYPKWFLREFPAMRVDIVLSTHAHFDHDAVERPKGLMVLERLVGQFKLGDMPGHAALAMRAPAAASTAALKKALLSIVATTLVQVVSPHFSSYSVPRLVLG